jgi:hypothetical protein
VRCCVVEKRTELQKRGGVITGGRFVSHYEQTHDTLYLKTGHTTRHSKSARCDLKKYISHISRMHTGDEARGARTKNSKGKFAVFI